MPQSMQTTSIRFAPCAPPATPSGPIVTTPIAALPKLKPFFWIARWAELQWPHLGVSSGRRRGSASAAYPEPFGAAITCVDAGGLGACRRCPTGSRPGVLHRPQFSQDACHALLHAGHRSGCQFFSGGVGRGFDITVHIGFEDRLLKLPTTAPGRTRLQLGSGERWRETKPRPECDYTSTSVRRGGIPHLYQPRRRYENVARRTDLPDIRDLTEDPARDWQSVATTLGGFALSLIAFAAIVMAAVVAWQTRSVSHFHDGFFAVYALACVGVPVGIAVTAVRRSGLDIVVLLAVILPVIVWIFVAIMIAVIGSLDGKNVF